MARRGVSPLEAWLAMVQQSWLQVLVLVNKDTRSSSSSVAASEAVSFLQLLTVPSEWPGAHPRAACAATARSLAPQPAAGCLAVRARGQRGDHGPFWRSRPA